MTIAAGRRRWNRGVPCHFDRVVAIATVHFELPGVHPMAERDRLLRLVPDVDNRRVYRSEQTCGQISGDRQSPENGNTVKAMTQLGK